MTLEAGRRLGPFEVIEPLGAGGMGEVYRARDAELGAALRSRSYRTLSRRAPSVWPASSARRGCWQPSTTPASRRSTVSSKWTGSTSWSSSWSRDGHSHTGSTVALCLSVKHWRSRDRSRRHRGGPREGNRSSRPEALEHQGDAEREGQAARLRPGEGSRQRGPRHGLTRGHRDRLSDTRRRDPRNCALHESGAGAGEAVDKRTDVWAFGCVLYAMLTGRRAFGGSTTSDTIVSVLTGEPDWTALPAATPSLVRTLLHRCLNKDQTKRVHDIADVRIEIEEELAAPREEGIPALRGPRGRWLIAAALLIVAGAMAIRLRPMVSVPASYTQLTFRRGTISSARFAPDGRTRSLFIARPGMAARTNSTRCESEAMRRVPFRHPGTSALDFSTRRDGRQAR